MTSVEGTVPRFGSDTHYTMFQTTDMTRGSILSDHLSIRLASHVIFNPELVSYPCDVCMHEVVTTIVVGAKATIDFP